MFLTRYYLYQAAATSTFFQAIFFPYYEQRAGLAVATILLLQAGNTALRACLDLPFGALADRHSRRLCLAASSAGILLGAALLLVRPSLVTAIVAEAAFAMAAALRSGADSALLFDTLRADGHVERYPAAESRGQAVAAIGSGTTAVLGGLLAAVDLRLPYLATIGLAVAGVVLALRLDDRRPAGVPRLRDRSRMADAARFALRTPPVRWSIAVAVLAVTASHVFFYLQQPYLQAIGVPVAAFGVVFALTKLVTAWMAGAAHRVDGALGQRRTTALMLAVPVVGLGGMALATTPVGAAWILVRGILDGLWMPLANVYVNRRVDSRLRATLLSLQSVLARLTLSLGLALLGVATARLGVWLTLGIAACAVAATGICLVLSAPPVPCREDSV